MSMCEVHKHENGWLVEWSTEYQDTRTVYNRKGERVGTEPITRYKTHTAVFTEMKAMLNKVKQLAEGAIAAAQGAQAIFVEVPVGSQSARAMAGYAICCGVLGSLRAMGIQFFEVTPKEVKLAAAGKDTATKKEMIQWAKTKHPEAMWPTYKKLGKELISEGTAEHMADAVGAIYAGLSCNSYQQMLTYMRQRII